MNASGAATVGTAAGERKIVTVLFCDLVGSTQIAESMDPEDYRDLLDEYLEMAIGRIDGMEGMVNQLAGDGFMALFGAPRAREDAPERAVEAALGIQDALAAYNREHHDGGIELRARIGIHTGPVVVGNVGSDLKADYTAIGDTTNLASRLQSLAAPGRILISDATRRLVAGQFDLRAGESLDIAGKSAPVTAYVVEGRLGSITPIGLARARGLTPRVGLDGELAQLGACFERLAEGFAQVVSVVGEAGSGKSRLVYEFKRRLQEQDSLHIEARGSSLTRNVPLTAVTSILKQLFQIEKGDSSESVRRKVEDRLATLGASTADLLPGLIRMVTVGDDDLNTLQPEEEIRQRSVAAVGELLERLSREKPLVMTIEDLHWLDDGSRELIEMAVSRMYRERIMVVLTHRPELSFNWRTSAAVTQLRLRPLGREQAVEIVRARAGGRLPRELEHRILERADGNPYFLEELTRGLLEQGQIVHQEGEVKVTRPVHEVEIPATVQELIGARLDRLSAGAKRTVQVASVFGREFHVDQLAQLLAAERIDLDHALEDLELRGIVYRTRGRGPAVYRFGESLTQAVAYEGLLLKERRQLHERIANLLESEEKAGDSARGGLVAQHMARSENRPRAIRSLLKAGKEAKELPSYSTALELYREAWKLGEEELASGGADVEATKRAILDATAGLCELIVLYTASGRADEERAAGRACQLAEELGDSEALATMCSRHGMLVVGGDRERFSEGIALIERGLEIAEGADLAMAATSIKRALAMSCLLDGRFDRAARLNDEILESLAAMGQDHLHSDFWVATHYIAANALMQGDDLEGAIRSARHAEELAVAAGNRTVESAVAGLLARAQYQAGSYTEARDSADRALEIGRDIGNVGAIRSGLTMGMAARLELGEPASLAPLREFIDQHLESGGDLIGNDHLLVDLLLRVGELERAEKYASRIHRRGGGRMHEMHGSIALGNVYQQRGAPHWGEAATLFDRALELARELGVRSAEAEALLGQGTLALEMDRPQEAQRLLRAARKLAEELGFACHRDRADRLLALLAGAVPEI